MLQVRVSFAAQGAPIGDGHGRSMDHDEETDMRIFTKLAAAALVTAGTAAAVVAAFAAEERCTAPMADWQPRSALIQMAEGLGWVVSRIRADDGCYVIRGRDKDGKPVRARVDPVSLKVLSTRSGRERHHDDDEDDGDDGREGRGHGHRREGGGRSAADPRPAPGIDQATPPAGGVLTGKPKVQIQ